MAVPVMLMISGPSGVGKTTVARRLLAENDGLERVVTCTTRVPRQGEIDGVDYHFLSDGEFMRAVKKNEFMEHAEVYGRRYGTRSADVRARLSAGGDVLLVNDVQGSQIICELASSDEQLGQALVTVYLVTEGLEELRARLVTRGMDAPALIEQRLKTAADEIARGDEFEHVIMSGSREEDWRGVQQIYQRARES